MFQSRSACCSRPCNSLKHYSSDTEEAAPRSTMRPAQEPVAEVAACCACIAPTCGTVPGFMQCCTAAGTNMSPCLKQASHTCTAADSIAGQLMFQHSSQGAVCIVQHRHEALPEASLCIPAQQQTAQPNRTAAQLKTKHSTKPLFFTVQHQHEALPEARITHLHSSTAQWPRCSCCSM
jgi:hypothetical protein